MRQTRVLLQRWTTSAWARSHGEPRHQIEMPLCVKMCFQLNGQLSIEPHRE
jgi:hypothetical protein